MHRHILIILFLCTNGLHLFAQDSTCSTAQDVLHTLKTHHFDPKPVDDRFSELVFNQVLEDLDDEKLIFSKEDFEKISMHMLDIDDQIESGNCTFLDQVTLLYKKRLSDIESLLTSLKPSDFDLQSATVVNVGTDIEFVDEETMFTLWKDLIQVEILSDIISLDPLAESANIQTTFENKLESSIDSRVCRLKTRFDQNSIEEVVADIYLQAICFAFDPHSAYMSFNKKKQFDNALSDESMSFGFSAVPKDNGYLEIESLTPGGAAWKSNQLNEGDIILSIAGNDQHLDLKCISWVAITEFIMNANLKAATFLIRKKNQEEIEVFLKKETVEVEANIIQSYILESENKKIGYLYLPSFYSNAAEDAMPSDGCSNDIAKELLRLKKENIDGLIFDLRDNGGGYMYEAIRLAGIFVDYGAIAVAARKGEEPQTLKDPNRGSSYHGPMVVLVNGYSASASELFASAMQDQNRAIIVGNSTFGKATIQTVLPLENAAGLKMEDEFVKVTSGKFYRVTGESHQNEGVLVDVSIPTEHELVNFREKDYPSALQKSTIEKKTYYYPKTELPIEKLNQVQKVRMDSSPYFQETIKLQQELLNEQAQYLIPVGYDALKEIFDMEFENSSYIETNSDDVFQVKQPSYLTAVFDFEKSDGTSFMEQINEDESIKESFRILIDLIKVQ